MTLRPARRRDLGPRGVRSSLRRRSFGKGLRQRNPLVLVVAAGAVAVGLVGLHGVLLDWALTTVDEPLLLRSARDDYLHVAVRVRELRADPPKTKTIYLFGGSGTTECFVSESSFAAAITRDSGESVRLVSLAAHQETLGMTLALVDNLPAGPALLAIGLGPLRVTGDPARDAGLLSGRGLLVRSPRLAELAPRFYGRGASPTVIPGIVEYLDSYRLERTAGGHEPWVEKIEFSHHHYPPGTAAQLPLSKRRNVLYVIQKDVTLYRLRADYNLAMLEEIFKLAAERGFDVALYDQPLNTSAASPDWGGVVPAYRERARRLAERYGVPYLDVGRNVQLSDHDFLDLYHLVPESRPRWQSAMARQIAASLRVPAHAVRRTSGSTGDEPR